MIDIVVTDGFFDHKDGSKLFGTIYMDAGEFSFPAVGWTDFVEDVLSTWAHELLRHERDKQSHFTLYFMDGPYELDILKNGEAMAMRCVDHGRVSHQIECGYDDFSGGVGQALRSLNELLLAKQGWKPDGPFSPAIAHNLALVKKLTAGESAAP